MSLTPSSHNIRHNLPAYLPCTLPWPHSTPQQCSRGARISAHAHAQGLAMASETTSSGLLALPDPWLLAVMQCCDTRSVLSAATVHSRLQRAAVEALSSISAEDLDKARSDSLLLYLAKHGQHMRSLALCAPTFDVLLRELPLSLTKLDSLQLEGLRLQLQPDVLRAGFPLTRLELSNCRLLDGGQGLAAALMQLPDMQHLSVDMDGREALVFPVDVLSHLVQLTSLRLSNIDCCNSSSSSSRDPSAALQPLQALTRLADLQLESYRTPTYGVTADTLSGAGQLTRLVLSQQLAESRALAGKTQLQHLTLWHCSFVPGTDMAQLLSELQHLTQPTHLDLGGGCKQRGNLGGPSPPPAAYASLTASSKLQHLDFRLNTLPSAAWQYMCPPGRTLPHLRYLDITYVDEADCTQTAPASALVSCCPGLQSLKSSMPCSTAQLAPLQRLTGLHTLTVGSGHNDDLEGVQALCQLTGLRDLKLLARRAAEARVLQLTQLTHLTALTFPQGPWF